MRFEMVTVVLLGRIEMCLVLFGELVLAVV